MSIYTIKSSLALFYTQVFVRSKNVHRKSDVHS